MICLYMRVEFEPIMAKPGIPVEKPLRRAVPDVPDPMPRRLPEPDFEPVEPVKEPREPVRVGS